MKLLILCITQMRDVIIRRSAARSRLAINRLVRSGAVGGRRPRPFGAPLRPRYARKSRTGSATMLTRKRKSESNKPQRLEALGGQITKSFYMSKHRPTSQVIALKRVGASNHYTNTSALFFQANAGFQEHFSFTWLGLRDLANLRGMISNSLGTGSFRFVVESMICESSFTNTTNAPIELEIWDLNPRRDIQSTLNYTGGVASFPVYDQPDWYWRQGALIDAGLPPNPVSNSQFLGSSPFDCQLFRDYFVQKKKTTVLLPQGASHRHVVVRKTNRIVDDALIKQTGGITGWTGLTSYTMYNIKGLPIAITSDPIGATTSPAEVAVVNTYHYKFTWVQDLSNYNVNSDTLQSPAAPFAGTALLNVGSGLIDTFKQAL